ncbi:MAG: sel1 repeat family protein [Holosporales bacterium]|jgi:TPR repeat protein|nr:sel1 repeat family protein [Holosporales bacterium]
MCHKYIVSVGLLAVALVQEFAFAGRTSIKTVNKVEAKKVQSAENLLMRTADEEQVTKKEISTGTGSVNSAEVCVALIEMGKRYESAQELNRAMDCYKAAALIDSERAESAISSLELKIKDETERKKQDEEIQALQRGAKQGNAADAYKLGKIYYLKNNIDDALKMWILACENKHPKAPYRLALMYEKGDKVTVDLAKAEKFYRIGAANGHAECAYITSKLLEIDASNHPDKQKVEEEAFLLKKDAANRGHAVAAAEVGYIYASKGEHVKAKQYFEKAQKNASPNSTMTVSVRQIMTYNIAAEDTKMSKQ